MKSKVIFFLLVMVIAEISAQGNFGCGTDSYLFQYNDVYGVDLASGQSYSLAKDITFGNIEAVAYNPVDGFIWGHISFPYSSVVRISSDFTVETYEIKKLKSAHAGAINSEGIMYSKGTSIKYDMIDLNPGSKDYLEVIANEKLSKNIDIADWAFNSKDGFLYAAGRFGNSYDRLYKIDPEESDVEDLGEISAASGLKNTYGSAYFDKDGNFYVSANSTGAIYQIKDVQSIIASDEVESVVFAYGPASNSSDGARCPTASVAQEICGNDIDDDGDGLIDCEDPSCSDYDECIEGAVSGGGNGGLESNNRLSQSIAKRNYTRTKRPEAYPAVFGNKLEANIAAHKQTVSRGLLSLKDLIPVGIINETHAYESSPIDLVEITNADEVFSVDYFKKENSIASVLALKTSNGVYEHSKFICDRLLGAELNSVATIYVKDQPMIRSIIYRADGGKEFVLSFSARQADEGVVIESHWNLDNYTADATFYNFQIWSNSINDLVTLAEGVLDLIDAEENIVEYNTSDAPYVFVRRASYNSGKLVLDIMNNDFSKKLTIKGGLRESETDIETTLEENVELVPYQNYIEIETGHFFDLGFRIETEKNGTPDDLFVSDGPWGYDDSSASTNVIDFNISKKVTDTCNDCYELERNLTLKALTSDYVAAYRAITPRFEAVDLAAYDELRFEAMGTGELEVSLIKSGVSSWEGQLHASVPLSNENQTFVIPRAVFKTKDGETESWNDIKMVVMTMRAANGVMEEKVMTVNDLSFGMSYSSPTEELFQNDLSVNIHPNPVDDVAHIIIETTKATTATMTLMNTFGKFMSKDVMDMNAGVNKYTLTNEDYPAGSYYLIVELEDGARRIKEIIITK